MTLHPQHRKGKTEIFHRRKIKFLRAIIVLGCALLADFPVFSDPVVSILPQDLLQALPVAPTDWILLQSIGKMRFSLSDTPETSVIRQYKVPPPKVNPPPLVPPLPGMLTLSVFDLGSLGNQRDNPPITTKKDDLFPLSPFTGSSFQTRKNKDLFFSGMTGSRILVQITARDILSDDFKAILKTLDFTSLVAAEQQLPNTTLRAGISVGEAPVINSGLKPVLGKAPKFKTLTLETLYVDELHPQFNRRSIMTRLQLLP